MNEQFLHYIWQQNLFNKNSLQTDCGKQIEVIHVGHYNTNAGPDFFNAKILIDGVMWAGNVEIHKLASDWIKHNHHADSNYYSVILHVVQEVDCEISRTNGEKIPQLVLTFPDEIAKKYQSFTISSAAIPCAQDWTTIDPIHIRSWMDSLLVKRLEAKTQDIRNLLSQYANNWEEVFYIQLARHFGQGLNSDSFEQLARHTPLSCLLKHIDNPFQIEAILFGQASLIPNVSDAYASDLKSEYEFLKHKFQLTAIDAASWKLLRLRPNNFPCIRISQFSNLICSSQKLFSKMLEAKSLKDLEQLFNCRVSDYWQIHYQFGQFTEKRGHSFGKAAIHNLIINVAVPFLFAYSELKNDDKKRDFAIQILESLPSENNAIIRAWQEINITSSSAFDSQALIHWKKNYCDTKDCLRCAIGHKVLKKLIHDEVS